jgi:predicted nucleotidyltransferase component of viral defense system
MKYEKQVALLIDLIPSIATETDFALKGGTAINLFYMDMPRLSVDLDLVYLPIMGREQTLSVIDDKLKQLQSLIQKRHPYLKIEARPSFPALSRQILCRYQDIQVKIEVNIIIRGTLYPVQYKQLSQAVQNAFKKNAQMQVVSIEDLYGSKICAALDRQHPRDLYDIMIFLEKGMLSREVFNAFLFYLISHNRPMAEVIAPAMIDIESIYLKDFIGMTKEPIALAQLLETRQKLVNWIRSCFTQQDKELLLSIKSGNPKWQLSEISDIENFPSIQWKLRNIRAMERNKRVKAYKILEQLFLSI